ncbi:hypothetical protein ACFYXH_30500 [Streptomyces sp. NPDC002730]|uniref:hypothetical protein n=1 Tax=Streptomyces sp. NPDC002730 TaxID=3364662 RepID=UPI00368024FC
MSQPANAPGVPKALNPLWIISLFLTVSEAAAGTAATQTQGWLQAVLVLFSVAFPVGVASAFFAILVQRPYVLYAPKDYSKNPSVRDFVNALNTSRNRSVENMEASIRSAMEEVVPKMLDAKISALSRDVIVAEAIESAREDFRHRFIEISYGQMDHDVASVQIPVGEDTVVQEFLNEAWSFAPEWIPPYTYGDKWVLVDQEKGLSYRKMGALWARRNGKGSDDRLLYSTGISAGDILHAVPLN